MSAFLAVIAFCVNNQCAFFASNTMTDSVEKCKANGFQLEAQLVKQFGPDLQMLVGCVKVPMKLASETIIERLRQG
jgi:ribosomal protein L9